MKEELITTLVEKTLKEVKKFGYVENSYKIFERHYKNLIKFYNEKKIENYSYETSVLFLKEKWNIDITQGNYSYWQSRKCRAIKILDDVYNHRELRIRYNYTSIILSDNNQILLNKYLDYNQKIGLSSKNINGIKQFISRFLKHLEDNKINVSALNVLNINEYLLSFKSISKISLKDYIFMLKEFLNYLFENNIIDKNYKNQLPSIKRPKNSKLPSVWSFDELNQVINSIDRTSYNGKRDYAIILLAITTALRGYDIINLKLTDINFKENIITVIQEKTKREIIIPLMDKTKDALLDYINNARPTSNYPHIFLSCNAISRPITNTSALSTMLKRYSNKVGLTNNKKRGIHSLRHTTLNFLFNDNETSLTTITEISGHYNPDSLNAYIKTDITRLAEFTLTIKDFGGDQDE